MSLQRIAAIISCMFVPTDSAAGGRPAPLSGIYSNVFEHPKTGDLLGTEIEIHADVSEPYAFVTLCEGWCNLSYRVPVRINGDQIQLRFAEQYVQYPSGTPADKVGYEVNGRLVGRTLKITLRGGNYSEVQLLKRRARRFGLAVAHPERTKP